MSKRSILLGLFFLITLGVLGYFTLFMKDFNVFRDPARMSVHFSGTNGLREGDSVLVAGMRWGRVERLDFDPTAPNDRRILVRLTLNQPLALREGFQIRIEDATLLGGKNLSIDPGPAEKPEVPPDTMLFGEVAPSPLQSIGRLVQESSQGISEIVAGLGQVVENVRGGKGIAGRLVNDEGMAENLAAALASASQTLAGLQTVVADLTRGRGTAGQLLENDALYVELLGTTRQLNEMLVESTKLVKSVGAGEGIAGRLLADQELGRSFASLVSDLGAITARINRGEGTLGKFLVDDAIATDISTFTSRLAKGEGSLGALMTKSDLYDNLNRVGEDAAAITGAIRSGQGTLGRLVTDPEIYNQIRTALQIVQRSLEEYREAAPITAFTAVFFAAW
jgi:phospholipid/cholesterol/gamma-HCH transport system substrate-binding protein